MKKDEWMDIINNRQNMYVEQLVSLIKEDNLKKTINFNSPTGTGKTVMISKLIDKMVTSNYFFIITTLSRGGLNKQVYSSLNNQTRNPNFIVFGVSSYTASTKLQGNEILNSIPKSKEIIWVRDEGHIKSNNWMKILEERAFKIINVSATNEHVDIQCNFTDTPLLRTPYQMYGAPEDAIKKLIEIKKIHEGVINYNPCLIVRDVSGSLTCEFIKLCDLYELRYIDITEKSENIQKLCENDNNYDVIINKMKIIEGIDIPRASVIYIGNRPSNDATIIQLIGRVRRNALLWSNDIDIFDSEHTELLKETSKTYVYYSKNNSAIQMEDGELVMELSDTISVEQLLPDSVNVKEGKLENGYNIAELSLLNFEYSGKLILSHNERFVKITNLPNIYRKCIKEVDEFGTKFKMITKDTELVMISFDKNVFTKVNGKGCWRISTTVSDNIKFGKLNKFIRWRYKSELLSLSEKIPNQTSIFLDKSYLDKKVKMCLNYIIKYYLKYLIFGKKYIEPFYKISLYKFSSLGQKKYTEMDVVIFAICLCYREQMNEFYGAYIDRLIPTIRETEILEIPSEIKEKIKMIAEKGVDAIVPLIFPNSVQENSIVLSPHLGNPNIMHGVADIVTETTIVQMVLGDLIKKEDLYKGFALHFLSTKRYDLKIDKIIFYNLITNQMLTVEITSENLSKLTFMPAIISSNKYKMNTYYQKNYSSLKSYFSNYGKQLTLDLINDFSNQLLNKKQFSIKNGNKSEIITQKKLLKSAHSIKDRDIDNALLRIMQPSIDTLEYAVSTQNLEMVKKHLSKVKPNKNILDMAIKTRQVNIIQEIILNMKVDVSNLVTAIKTGDDKLISLISDNFIYSRNMAKFLIRTRCQIVIKKLFENFVPTTSNLVTAIKTNDEDIVRIVIDKIPRITSQCLEVAKATKNDAIIDIICNKMYNKSIKY